MPRAVFAAGCGPEGMRPMRLRGLVLQVHLYGGLICFWYLLVFGISSLSFQHEWLLPAPSPGRTHWERAIAIPELSGDGALADAIRDASGLPGWPMPWTMRRDEEGELHYEQAAPGRQFWIHVDRSAGMIRVEEQRKGLRSILRILHGPTEGVPNLPITAAWCVYTEFTTWFVLFSVVSGVYLWASRASRKRLAAATLLASVGISMGLMTVVYFAG
jgi:hypothetical protein